MTDINITFIGAGNMAASIIGGLIAQGFNSDRITATDPQQATLDGLSSTFSIKTSTDNRQACQQADVIVFAVKPQVLKQVAQDLAPVMGHQPLIISVAAGIDSEHINKWLGGNLAIVRCMPNTPALVQCGASGLYANAQTTETQKQQAKELLDAVGNVVWLEQEELIDAVTAVSGSGPAYFFLLMESMIAAGVKQGLTVEQATRLTLQTAAGAATLAKSSDVSVDELRRRVTSPGGTTEQAIMSFEHSGFKAMVDEAMTACADRSRVMAKEFS